MRGHPLKGLVVRLKRHPKHKPTHSIRSLDGHGHRTSEALWYPWYPKHAPWYPKLQNSIKTLKTNRTFFAHWKTGLDGITGTVLKPWEKWKMGSAIFHQCPTSGKSKDVMGRGVGLIWRISSLRPRVRPTSCSHHLLGSAEVRRKHKKVRISEIKYAIHQNKNNKTKYKKYAMHQLWGQLSVISTARHKTARKAYLLLVFW